MKYKYSAKTQEGELQVGFVEAANRDAASAILVGHNLFILSIAESEKEHWYDRVASFFGGVKRKDMVIMTRQLSILLEARLPLDQALKTLANQTSNTVLREAVIEVSQDVDAGLSLSQALGRQGSIFNEF